MLIVAGSLVFEPGVREQFLEMRTPGLLVNRQEPGCLEYVIGADPADESRLFMYQLWADQEALDTHMAKVRSMDRSGGGPAPTEISVKTYAVADSSPLSR